MKKKIHIIIVEDHRAYREVVEMALAREPDMELNGQFSTAEAALQGLQQDHRLKGTDIVLLDINLPAMSGLDALPLISKTCPGAKIIVLTQSDREADVLKAISLGASGYLLKSASRREISDGIRTVMAGGASLDVSVAKLILKTLRTHLPQTMAEPMLSKRELEIMTLLAEGLSKKEIAGKLDISATTVVTYIERIYEKLNVTSAPAAVNKAHRFGLFQPNRE
jgi:two-component system nitrate/nitrite response regulator NarL